MIYRLGLAVFLGGKDIYFTCNGETRFDLCLYLLCVFVELWFENCVCVYLLLMYCLCGSLGCNPGRDDRFGEGI